MLTLQIKLATTLAMLLTLVAPLAVAAEIRLRRECVPATALVTLADVAEIHAVNAAEAEKLGGVQLFAAPAAGKSRFLPIRELQDLLLLRGINLAGHTLSGASQTVIHTPVEETPEPEVVAPPQPAERPLARHERDRAVERITDEIVRSLNAEDGSAAWQVEIASIHGDLRPFVEASVDSPLFVAGGQKPWTGKQKFEVRRTTEDGEVVLSVVAEVTLPAMILAATRTLARGTIIQAGDLQFQPRRTNDANIEALELPEEAVGRQVTRSIPAGAVLSVADVREPIVVRRGDAVTVYSRAPGVRVRTTARAKQDGGLGDLIEIESFATRTTFYARVSGSQEVEIFAHATTIAPPARAVPAAEPAPVAPAPVAPNTARAASKGVAVEPVAAVDSKNVVWRRSSTIKTRPVGE